MARTNATLAKYVPAKSQIYIKAQLFLYMTMIMFVILLS